MKNSTRVEAKIAGDTGVATERLRDLLYHIRASRIVLSGYVHDQMYDEASRQQNYTGGLMSALDMLGASIEDIEACLASLDAEIGKETGDA